MANWKDREMCEPHLNEDEDENPFISGGAFWEVTFRTSWTALQGDEESDTFEARRLLAGENAVGFLLDNLTKQLIAKNITKSLIPQTLSSPQAYP